MAFSASAFSHFLQRYGYRVAQLIGRGCVGCSAPCSAPLCNDCLSMVTLPVYRCRVCGIALSAASQDLRCQPCIANPPAFEALHCIGNYDDLLANTIVRAKIARQPSAIETLRYLQSRSLQLLTNTPYSNYTVMAMPTPKLRLMQRGFNLPHLLACDLAKSLHLPMLPADVVKLPLHTTKQALKSGKQRKKYRPTYQINDNLPENILIVDDIITTGQTLHRLAKKLKQNGAKSVMVWVLARTQHKEK